MPLAIVGRGGGVGSKSRAGVKDSGVTAAEGKNGAGAGGARLCVEGGARPRVVKGESTLVVGGRSMPAGRNTMLGATREEDDAGKQ